MKSKPKRKIPSANSIQAYMHCAQCLHERPNGTSPKDWCMLNVGWTALGLQVWCTRHNDNVVHIDFQGNKVQINTGTSDELS